MKTTLALPHGVEVLVGTRDENLRLLEQGFRVRLDVCAEGLKVDGDEASIFLPKLRCLPLSTKLRKRTSASPITTRR